MVQQGVTKTTESHQHRVAHCFLIYTHPPQKKTMDTGPHHKKITQCEFPEEKKHRPNQSLSPQQKHLEKSRLLKHPLADFLWPITPPRSLTCFCFTWKLEPLSKRRCFTIIGKYQFSSGEPSSLLRELLNISLLSWNALPLPINHIIPGGILQNPW